MSDRQIDWQAIRSDYESGSSLRQLSKTYGISKTYLIEKRDKEGWNRPPTTDHRPPTTLSTVSPPISTHKKGPMTDVQRAVSPLKQNKIVPLAQLIPHPRNYRAHPKEQIDKLVLSLQRFGQGRSIVCQDSPDKMVIVAGHGVVEAAQALEWKGLRADILPADWSPAQIDGYLIADNLHSQDASDDDTLLAHLLSEQADAGYDLASLGSDEETLRQMLASLGDAMLGDKPDVAFKEFDESIADDLDTEMCQQCGKLCLKGNP